MTMTTPDRMTTPDSERELVAFVEARLGELWVATGQHFPGKLEFTSVRALAASWKDHPDYRPEWAPDAG